MWVDWEILEGLGAVSHPYRAPSGGFRMAPRCHPFQHPWSPPGQDLWKSQQGAGKLWGDRWDIHVPSSCGLISSPGAMELDQGPATPFPALVGWEWDIWPSLGHLVDKWEHVVAGDKPLLWTRDTVRKAFNGSTEEMVGEFWRRQPENSRRFGLWSSGTGSVGRALDVVVVTALGKVGILHVFPRGTGWTRPACGDRAHQEDSGIPRTPRVPLLQRGILTRM